MDVLGRTQTGRLPARLPVQPARPTCPPNLPARLRQSLEAFPKRSSYNQLT